MNQSNSTSENREIKLYGYPTSPFVLKVGCYLKFKRLPFKFMPVNPLTREQIKFTDQIQVPVLSIGDNWKNDSSVIGCWLDEQFPEISILGQSENERNKILAIDDWISNQLLPARFRGALKWDNNWNAIRNGWMLGSAMRNSIDIPRYLVVLWPLLIKRAKFLHKMVNNKLDLAEPLWDMHERLADELVVHLGSGLFLGGGKQPSLADLSAYPIIIFAHLMGLHGRNVYLENDIIVQWCQRVQSHLPNNPLLVPDQYLKRDLL